MGRMVYTVCPRGEPQYNTVLHVLYACGYQNFHHYCHAICAMQYTTLVFEGGKCQNRSIKLVVLQLIHT